MVFMLQLAIRIIDLTPIFFGIGMVILAGWGISVIIILSGREKHDREILHYQINHGEKIPFLRTLKRIGYSFFILGLLAYVTAFFVEVVMGF